MRVDRIDKLEDYIIHKKSVTLDSLCEEFGISKNTLRRDIDALIDRGNIEKVYGGVVAVERKESVGLRSFEERNTINLDLKEYIAERAASLISEKDILFIDTGSSTVPLIKHLAKMSDITIVTNSVPVIYSALSFSNLNVIALPGTLNHPTDSLVGAACLEALKNFHVTKSIMSCTGLSIDTGVCNASFPEFEIKRVAMALCEKSILLADHTKFGVSSMMSYSRIEHFDYLVTDELPDAIMQGYAQDRNVKIVV